MRLLIHTFQPAHLVARTQLAIAVLLLAGCVPACAQFQGLSASILSADGNFSSHGIPASVLSITATGDPFRHGVPASVLSARPDRFDLCCEVARRAPRVSRPVERIFVPLYVPVYPAYVVPVYGAAAVELLPVSISAAAYARAEFDNAGPGRGMLRASASTEISPAAETGSDLDEAEGESAVLHGDEVCGKSDPEHHRCDPGPVARDKRAAKHSYEDRFQESSGSTGGAEAGRERQPRSPDQKTTVVGSRNTLLVFRAGRQVEIQNYAIQGEKLFEFTSPRTIEIPLTDLDLKATVKANAERGLDFHLP